MDRKSTSQFNEKGYCLIENGLPKSLLDRWKILAERLEQNSVAEHKNSNVMPNAAIVDDPVGPRIMRYNNVFTQDHELALETIACEGMLAVIRDLCGIGSVPTQMDLMFKQQHPHPVVEWHQDVIHERKYPYINIGIYLDDAPRGDGCLSYVPGTQFEQQDVEGLAKNHGWEIPGAEEQPAKAGDILVQDMMVLHGSKPKIKPGVRRTIYLEVRPWRGILESGINSQAWVDLRRKWMSLVLSNDVSGTWPAEWKKEYPVPENIESSESLFADIIKKREAGGAANWATYPIKRSDYPVPEDIQLAP